MGCTFATLVIVEPNIVPLKANVYVPPGTIVFAAIARNLVALIPFFIGSVIFVRDTLLTSLQLNK